MFTSPVYIEDVDRNVGTSLQLMAETDVENATLEFRLVVVTDGQDRVVNLNSTGYLTIAPGANVTTFFIDVSLQLYTPIYYPTTPVCNECLQIFILVAVIN